MSYYNSNFEEDLEEMLESFKHDPQRQVHMRLLADAFFENLQRDDVEFGGWGVDSKRPFGNSYVEGDLAEIVGVELPEYKTEDYEDMCVYLRSLYADLGTYLKYRWKAANEW